MKFFFLGSWIAAAVLVGAEWTMTGSLAIGMMVWGASTFAGWAVLVLAGR